MECSKLAQGIGLKGGESVKGGLVRAGRGALHGEWGLASAAGLIKCEARRVEHRQNLGWRKGSSDQWQTEGWV